MLALILAGCDDPLHLLWEHWTGLAPHVAEGTSYSCHGLAAGQGWPLAWLSVISHCDTPTNGVGLPPMLLGKGSTVATVGALVYRFIFSLPWSRSCFVGALVLVWLSMAGQESLCKDASGGRQVGSGISAGELQGRAHDANKVGRVC